MKRVKLIILFLLACFPTLVFASTVEENQNAVLAAAEAYFAQGKQVQYDSFKRNLNCTPEDATSQHYCYANCSSFAYMVYKNALGKEIPVKTDDLLNYAANRCNGYNNDAVACDSYNGIYGYVVDYDTVAIASDVIKSTRTEVKDNLKDFSAFYIRNFLYNNRNKIKPGDLIVWEHVNGNAHVMLVESVNFSDNNKKINIIQVGGGGYENEGRYDVDAGQDRYEENGAVSKAVIDLSATAVASVKDVLFMNEVVNEEESPVYNRNKIAIIRFATSNDSLSESAIARNKYKDISIAKIVYKINDEKVSDQSFAKVGDKITYYLKVVNNSRVSYSDLKFEEKIAIVNSNNNALGKKIAYNVASSVSFSGGSGASCEVRNKVVKCSVSTLSAGDSFILKFNVTINGDRGSTGSAYPIVLSNGTVGTANEKISTSTIETLIGKGLSESNKSKLFNRLKFYKSKVSDLSSLDEGRTKKYDYGDNRVSFSSLKNVKGIDFISTLYKEVLNLDLHINGLNLVDTIYYKSSFTNASVVAPVDPSGNPDKVAYGVFVKYTDWGSSEAPSDRMYLYSNFYGLELFGDDNDNLGQVKASKAWNQSPKYELYDRARTLTTGMLEDGDVILVRSGSTTLAYIYFDDDGNSSLYRYRYNSGNSEFVVTEGDNLTKFLRDLIGKHYVVLRPYLD